MRHFWVIFNHCVFFAVRPFVQEVFFLRQTFQYKNWPQNWGATITTKTTLIYRLVHAITPLEENKSFLEKVQLAGKLCGVEELWKQKEKTTQQKIKVTSSTQVKDNSEDNSDSDSDDPIILSSHIKWSEKKGTEKKSSRHQQKSRLMPSFTKKCLEFHNCPEAVFPKPREKGNMHFSLRDRISFSRAFKREHKSGKSYFVHQCHHPQCFKNCHKGLTLQVDFW